MWSNWPDEPAKKQWVSDRVAEFEAGHPDCSPVKLSFIPKADEYTQAKSAVRTGQAPDIFYMEPDQPEFVSGGYLEPLDSVIDLANLNDWARQAWSYKDHVYAVPAEAYTIEISTTGTCSPSLRGPAGQLSAHAGRLCRDGGQSRRRHVTAVAEGVGDRPFPGAFLPYEALLHQPRHRRLRSPAGRRTLLQGPAVVAALTWFKASSTPAHTRNPSPRSSSARRTTISTRRPAPSPSRTRAGTPAAPSPRQTKAASRRASRSASCRRPP